MLYHYPTKADLFWVVVDMFEDLQRVACSPSSRPDVDQLVDRISLEP